MKNNEYIKKIFNFFSLKQKNTEQTNKNYILKLVENLVNVKSENKTIPFYIISIKEKGFQIKVGGLFSFVPFRYMPWEANNYEYWKIISYELINKKFFCKINKIEKDPIYIQIDARVHKFDELKFEKESEVSGIIISKKKYGMFIEIGHFYNWQYGSCIGLLHKNNVEDYSKFENKSVGESINTIFYGFKDKKHIILGDNYVKPNDDIEWEDGNLEKYVNTIQKVVIVKDKQGSRKYILKDKYIVKLPIIKSLYLGKNRKRIKILLNRINTNETITCEIVTINKNKKHFIAKWLISDKSFLTK